MSAQAALGTGSALTLPMSMTISGPKTSAASAPTNPKPTELPKSVDGPELNKAEVDGTKPKNLVEQANIAALAKSADPQSALRQLTGGQQPIPVSQLQTLIGTAGKDVAKGAGAANSAALPDSAAPTQQGARVENGKVVTPEGKEAPLDQWLVADGQGGFQPLAENGQVTSPPVRFRMANDELKVEIMNPTKGADRVEDFVGFMISTLSSSFSIRKRTGGDVTWPFSASG